MLEIASPRKSSRGLADLCPAILRPEGLRQQHRQSPSSQACSPRSNWCLAENSNRLSFRDKIGFLLAKIFGMRKTISEPSFLGSTDIGAVKPNAKSRNDISAHLIGFQAIYADEGTRTELFRLFGRRTSFRAAAWTLYGFSILAIFRGSIRRRPKTVCRIWAGCFPAVRILRKTASGDGLALIDIGCHSPKAT